jgi:hypothetical protein
VRHALLASMAMALGCSASTTGSPDAAQRTDAGYVDSGTNLGADSGVDSGAQVDSGEADSGPSDSGRSGDSGIVSLNVLLFPGASADPHYADVATYLLTNPVVAGATIAVEWSSVDADGGYFDWSYPDNQINAWVNAGKKANLVIWANADSSNMTCGTVGQYGQNGTGNCSIPGYVWQALGASNYTTCDSQYGVQRMPNYFAPAFMTSYQNFIARVLQKYGSDPNIGYIRVGLGHGGESIPVAGWNDLDGGCGQAFVNQWGLTIANWESYLGSMLQFESSKDASGPQLMVGITPMGNPSDQVPDYLAPAAVALHIGFGSQGLEESDVNNCAHSTANWCTLFSRYTGQVPLELQTIGQSCPNGGCPTGSLSTLVPFAVANHANIFEIYWQDWLTAFDPNYPGYYPAYQTVLQQAAAGN